MHGYGSFKISQLMLLIGYYICAWTQTHFCF